MANCKPGDLAVVVQAQHKSNLGRIVRVIGRHHGKGPLFMVRDCPVWTVEGPAPMTWRDGSKLYVMTRGPVPDEQLQPIRAQPTTKRKRTSKVLEAV